jgi:hypothetical protein
MIPHASDLLIEKHKPRVARYTRQWARQIFPVMLDKKWLSLLSKRWGILLDLVGIAGFYRAEYAIFLFERLYLLEKKIRDAGLNFDWECI